MLADFSETLHLPQESGLKSTITQEYLSSSEYVNLQICPSARHTDIVSLLILPQSCFHNLVDPLIRPSLCVYQKVIRKSNQM